MDAETKAALEELLERWRAYVSFTSDPSYSEGIENGLASAADDLESVLINYT